MTLSPEIEKTELSFLYNAYVSIIIPAYNVQSKIAYSIRRIREAVAPYFKDFEMIVVNDGSTDDTLTVLNEIASTDQQHLRVLSYSPNRGKGYAVRHGVLHSQGNIVMYLDGDLDISPDWIKNYIERLIQSDLVIGSKRHPKSNITIPRSRKFLSRAFNILIKLAIGIPQTDTQVGLKAGNGEIMRRIFEKATVERYAFDVELLTIASILHLNIHEMPVTMTIDRRFNTKEIIKMLIDVMRIWYNYRIARRYQYERIENNNIA